MNSPAKFIPLAIAAVLIGCRSANKQEESSTLVGAWRSRITFSNGAFSETKNLEFLYVFNAGGTMTETSNYDAAPPVPPAYGIWRATGKNQFEAKYEFYVSAASGETTTGWLPGGRGILVENISLTDDGKSFTSRIRYEVFDVAGKPAQGSGDAKGEGVKVEF